MRRGLLAAEILACLLGLVLACYGSALLANRQFCYRDAAHFYYPLYHRVQQEWEAGRWPLWEPEENAGMPLLGNPTAAVLYPGKVIYAALPYAWGARIYVVAHTVLAFAGMLALLRSWQVSWAGAAIGALGYSFGGPILFQYCNIIFLVGAAWMPWGFRAVDRWVRQGRRMAMLELALVLAMQTLGGDPQAAYLTGLCAGGYALGLAWAARAPGPVRRVPWLTEAALALGWVLAVLAVAAALFHWAPARRQNPLIGWLDPGPWSLALWAVLGLVLLNRMRRQPGARALVGRLTGLAAAGTLALGLSAAQLLPVIEFARLSVRGSVEGPHEVYPFSLEPHRLAEMIWPNVFGTTFGENRYWLALVPPLHSPSTWVPSLYLGGLVFVLAAGTLGLRNGPPWRSWMAAVALLCFLASLGEYGSPIWWARSTTAGVALVGPHDPPPGEPFREDGALDDGDGSFYWLLATLLPGFGTFRYPSKLLTPTCLAVAALAGMGWDRLRAGEGRRTVFVVGGLLTLSLVGFVFVATARDPIVAAFRASPAAKGGSLFGPLHVEGAITELRQALAHGSVVFAIALAVVFIAPRRPVVAEAIALGFLTVDLAIANAGMVLTLPQSLFETPPRLLRLIEEAEKKDPSPGPFRVHRMPLWDPPGWYNTSSPDRLRDLVQWERDTLQPKYAIPYGLQYTLSEGVTELYDYWWFFGSFYRPLSPRVPLPGATPGQEVVYHPRRGFDLWNTRYFVLPVYPNGWRDEQRGYASFLPNTETVAPKASGFQGSGGTRQWQEWISREDWQILKNKDAFPRAWVVHDLRPIAPITGMGKQGRKAPMEEMLYKGDPLWNSPSRVVYDMRALAWVETDDITPLLDYLTRTPADPAETVTVTSYNPQRVELTATLKRPGIVILADVFYPGWELTIDGEPATILRTNRLMRGAAVKSGVHKLVYTYRPSSFRVGLGLSGLSLVTLTLAALWARRRGVSTEVP